VTNTASHTQLAQNGLKGLSTQGLGEDISQLKCPWNIRSDNVVGLNSFANKMTIYFNVFSAFMEHGIGSNVECSLVVTMQCHGRRMSNTKGR
jgi:hypothetical protein